MKRLIILFILLLFGVSNALQHDLIEWYRVYEAEGYLNSDSSKYMEIDLRLYPPEHLFYDSTISKYPWKMSAKYHQREDGPWGIAWITEHTVTYGEWYCISGSCMYLKADSLKEKNSVIWKRQKGDRTKNSYFLFDYGIYYQLKIYDLELAQFVDIVGFLKEDKYLE